MTATRYDISEHTASNRSVAAAWSVIGAIFMALMAL